MPWAKGAAQRREKLEELEEATTPIPLLKDTWVKARLILTHMAGLASLVSTMNTESAQQRYAIERLAHEVRTLREDSDARYTADAARWDRIGAP
jgi:hypothetical protein